MKMRTRGEVFGERVIALIMLLLAFTTLYPFWHVLMYSASESRAAMSGGLFFWPRTPSLLAYRLLLQTKMLYAAYWNTIARTAVATALSLLLSALTAYPLSVRRLRGRNFFCMYVFFTMLFGGGMIPTYLVVSALGLIDTFWALVLPGAISAYNMFILRNYFQSIPASLSESAHIDGASAWRVLFQIVLPLSGPALAAIGMFYGVANWNSYLDCVLYINSSEKIVLQVYLRQLLAATGATNALSGIDNIGQASRVTEETMKMVTIAASVIPVLLVYPYLQRFYMKGVMVGSVKG